MFGISWRDFFRIAMLEYHLASLQVGKILMKHHPAAKKRTSDLNPADSMKISYTIRLFVT